MKDENAFYVKNIVDNEISENTKRVDIAKIVEKVQKNIIELSDKDFIEVMIGCFIPDVYRDQGKKEKLYTKISELLVGEWWRRMGGTYKLPTKKSGTEDVEMILNDCSIVCDAKIFRLGRSQKAPNVKDFLKLASVAKWMENLKDKYEKNNKLQKVLGGLVTYPSLHEWEKDSEVYQECSNSKVRVIMLPYEILALLLERKETFILNEFLNLWNYDIVDMKESKNKDDYWKIVTPFLCELLDIDEKTYGKTIEGYRKQILCAKKMYKKLIEDDIEEKRKAIEEDINSFSDTEELKNYVYKRLEEFENQKNKMYLSRIDKYRKYS